MEHAGNNLVDSREKAAQQGTVHQKERAEFSGDGKDTMSVWNINDLK